MDLAGATTAYVQTRIPRVKIKGAKATLTERKTAFICSTKENLYISWQRDNFIRNFCTSTLKWIGRSYLIKHRYHKKKIEVNNKEKEKEQELRLVLRIVSPVYNGGYVI